MTDAIRNAIEGASAYLSAHPDEARYTDSLATARVVDGLLRAGHGFEVRAWAVRSEARLVRFLSHPGTVDELEAADGAYYASSERLAFDPDPRQYLIQAEHHFVEELSLPR